MKTTYFKIIELPTHQVLIEKDWDAEKEEYQVAITVWFDEMKVKQVYGYHTLKKADDSFDKWDENKCSVHIKNITTLIKNNS